MVRMTYALDEVNRLRIMAAGVRGARVAERVIPAPLDAVWAVMGDLEGEFGRFQPDMRSIRVLRVAGDRVEALARSKYGFRAHFRGCCARAGAGCRAVSSSSAWRPPPTRRAAPAWP